MAKMTKQVKKMVEVTNDYLRKNRVKDMRDKNFMFMAHLLLRAKCYHGFNYFTADGKLSGGDNEKFDHFEFYIK